MTEVKIEAMEHAKDKVVSAINKFGKRNRGFYADVRFEITEGKGAGALDGNTKGADEDYSLSIGTRVIANAPISAAGFYGLQMGKHQLAQVGKITEEMLNVSAKRAKINAQHKEKFRKLLAKTNRDEMLKPQSLAPTKIYQDEVKAKFKKNPRDYSIEDISRRVEKCSAQIAKIPGIASNSIGLVTGFRRKVFASTEGAIIDQCRALSEAFVYVAAKGKVFETFHESIGEYRGMEVLDGENSFDMSIEEFAKYLADGTIELSNAKTATNSGEEVTIITDPWYNTLVSHEICGHPSEADRALKREAAWAGRAWWFRNIHDNEFGKQVAGCEVSVFSDPTIEHGYGTYKYDDEGVKGKRIYNIQNGILNEFMNSRETAGILGKEPNGSMRASSADVVPIIRMSNTCFAPGKWKFEEMLADTREGYYVVGEKTPSIGETRQNFEISCWKLYKIEHGELTTLYRKGGVTADSYSFLKNIDAVGNDFRMFNVPNCGKGTPMQTMRVGNGGPHLRSKARISGKFGADAI